MSHGNYNNPSAKNDPEIYINNNANYIQKNPVADKTRITEDGLQYTYNAERSHQMSSADTGQQRIMHIEWPIPQMNVNKNSCACVPPMWLNNKEKRQRHSK